MAPSNHSILRGSIDTYPEAVVWNGFNDCTGVEVMDFQEEVYGDDWECFDAQEQLLPTETLQAHKEACVDRDFYSQKASDLQGLLRSCAVELVEHEKLLIQATQADDLDSELDDILHQIQGVMTDQEKLAKQSEATRLQNMLKFWGGEQRQAKQHQESMTPEKAIDTALTSLKASIEYFKAERAILTFKMDKLQDKMVEQRTFYKGRIEVMKERVGALEESLKQLTQQYQAQLEDKKHLESAMLKMGTQIHALAGERDDLASKCQTLELTVANTNKHMQEREEERRKEDQEIISTMKMMHDYIEELESEQTMLASQCQSQENIIVSLETSESHDLELKEEHEMVAGTASCSTASTKTSLPLTDLQAQHKTLMSNYGSQRDTITALEKENSSMRSHIESLEDEKKRRDNKLLLQKKNGEAQNETIARLKEGESEHDIKLQDMNRQFKLLVNENEQLSSRCTSLKLKLAILEQENKNLNGGQDRGQHHVDSTLVNLKAKVEHLEDEMDKRRIQCSTLQDTIALLKKEKQVNAAIAEQFERNVQESTDQLKARIRELESDRDQFDAKCKSQQKVIDSFQDPTPNEVHFIESEAIEVVSACTDNAITDFTSEEMKKRLQEFEVVKYKIASKSSRRESAIARLEEENDVKDARLEILEAMVQQLMAARDMNRSVTVKAGIWKEKLNKLPWPSRQPKAVQIESDVPTLEQALTFLDETPHPNEIFAHSYSQSDNLSTVSQ